MITAAREGVAPSKDRRAASLEETHQAIEHVAHFLPTQGPIGVFIHHNTLHAFEALPFHVGVQEGGRIYGCEPYLSEVRYREFLANGRIDLLQLAAVVERELGETSHELVASLASRRDLRLAMLVHPLYGGTDKELRWVVADSDALSRFRDDVPQPLRIQLVERARRWGMSALVDAASEERAASERSSHDSKPEGLKELCGAFLRRYGPPAESWSEPIWEAFTLQAMWRACREGVHGAPHAPTTSHAMVRHRDLFREATGVDVDPQVDEILIRFCAAFLDQGVAGWRLPNRDEGFLASFAAIYGASSALLPGWLRRLSKELARWKQAGLTPLEAVQESLDELGVLSHEKESFLLASALTLRGWAGMILQTELRTDEVRRPSPPGSFVEYLAVRLLVERLALEDAAASAIDFRESLSMLRPALRKRIGRPQHATVEQRAFAVFQLAQLLGWSPDRLWDLSRAEWHELVDEIEAFNSIERRRTLHVAYEERYLKKTLDALDEPTLKRQAERARTRPRPAFQAVFCLDDREESFRRHLEEVAPECETFGAAGFFGIPIYYRGVADAEFAALCPAVIKPQRWVTEDVAPHVHETFVRRRRARRLFGQASRTVSANSRDLFGGAVLSAAFGWLAAIPMTARVLFPRLTSRLRARAGALIKHPDETFLRLERSGDCAPSDHEPGLGFLPTEMADAVERMLRDMGLVRNFARLVIFHGHGAGSVNNPHQSAYNCGACGGGRGGPNARSFAAMANDPRVREMLHKRGLPIPEDTVFVGGFHDTTADKVEYFDVDRIPESHREEFATVERRIAKVCRLNAHERCRRFVSAPLDLTPDQALAHVEERAEDLSQTRPECGHATNAVTIVGRRARTRGLFMDRRAFLTSYDPSIDDENGTIVGRILAAVVPVCAGISLEYYFSYVDPYGYGCATKLPHNVACYLGVMDGAASDLRTGLPWQMVEIHEPMRPIFVIETTEDVLRKIVARDENVRRAFENEWARFALIHPQTGAISVCRDGEFVSHRRTGAGVETVVASAEVYRGQRDHLDFALISCGALPEATASSGDSLLSERTEAAR